MLAVSMFGQCVSHWGSAKKDSQGMVRPGHSSAYTTCHWVLKGTEAAVSFKVYYHPTQGSPYMQGEPAACSNSPQQSPLSTILGW